MINATILEHILAHSEVPPWCDATKLPPETSHAVRRLVSATISNVEGIDWALLVRQCIRRLPASKIHCPKILNEHSQDLLRKVGVAQGFDGTLIAEPYLPRWVRELGGMEIDRPQELRNSIDESVSGEPWLERLVGKKTWKSAAQKEAAWAAITAAPNSTLLVGLPTGSGKSLVYHCCAVYQPGLTVVVVPTNALGIDQLAALEAFASKDQLNPAFYTSDEKAASVLAAVDSRRCRLLITSPEAIVAGKLRSVLLRQAEEGFLGQLVIDEAHLIESWGADFRIEFQLLGATLRKWREKSPIGIKTLLLSATFSPQAPILLKQIFAYSSELWEERVIQKLRPEIHYFASIDWASSVNQAVRIEEALLRLPRPAILYVTKKSSAIEWDRRLTAMGFRRFRVFHGDTNPRKREEVLDQWRKDQIDLVVATSAFGMGVDKGDVKAVIHACLPEGIDRFYQEVGRGGRDGFASISLLVPGGNDRAIANQMGPTLLTDPVKIQGRWDAMWASRTQQENATFSIFTGAKPEHEFGKETNDESVRWNKRLLLLMERSELITILGLESKKNALSDAFEERATIQIHAESMSLEHDLPLKIQVQRTNENNANQRSLDNLMTFFESRKPICRILTQHYGGDTRKACGSCGKCRTGHAFPGLASTLTHLQPSSFTHPKVHIIQVSWTKSQKSSNQLIEIIRKIIRLGVIRRYFVSSIHRREVECLFSSAEDSTTGPYRIDNIDEQQSYNISINEKVVVIHFNQINLMTSKINERGSLVAHWQLGGKIETAPGIWPFMREYDSRPYSGETALKNWFEEVKQVGCN